MTQISPDYPRVRDLGGGVLQIDTGHVGNPGTIAVFAVLLPEGGFALVESGPGSTLQNVETGLAEAGLSLGDLRFLLLTHIHLDHAAAAGALLAKAPDARLVVHERGARHMVDPSRLMASAERVYGSWLEPLWGRMQPVEQTRVHAVAGSEQLELGGRKATVIATPGHASHHVSYLFGDGTLFTGDSAGVKLSSAKVIRPALPPPDLDLEAWENSIAAMRAAGPQRLILTHFGSVEGAAAADAHLAEVVERNRAWADHVSAGLEAGETDDQLVARVQKLEDSELEAAGVLPGVRMRYKLTSDASMTVMGLKRYFETRYT